MSEALTGAKTGIGLLRFFHAWLDPDKRRALTEQIEAHVLSEIPRVMRLLEDRISDVQASGCTPEEASIIAYQVIEQQRRTLDETKRQRLSNVLVNGLCSPRWDRATHRLMIQLTAELEAEHIERLRVETRSPSEMMEEMDRARTKHDRELQDQIREEAGLSVEERERRRRERASRQAEIDAVRDGIERDLVARGLMYEVTKPKVTMTEPESFPAEKVVKSIELNTMRGISKLGLMLLDFLRDPESVVAAD